MRSLLHIVALVAVPFVTVAADPAGPASSDAGSKFVIGPSNVYLADGANALLAGNFIEGIRLTKLGLNSSRSDRDRAKGYSNLCAGYIETEQYDEAIESCSKSLEYNDQSWHAYHNRGLAFLRGGDFQAGIDDLEIGLVLKPNSRLLLRALAAARGEVYDPEVRMENHH